MSVTVIQPQYRRTHQRVSMRAASGSGPTPDHPAQGCRPSRFQSGEQMIEAIPQIACHLGVPSCAPTLRAFHRPLQTIVNRGHPMLITMVRCSACIGAQWRAMTVTDEHSTNSLPPADWTCVIFITPSNRPRVERSSAFHGGVDCDNSPPIPNAGQVSAMRANQQ